MQQRRKVLAGSLALVAAFVLAACGDDDSDSGATPTTSESNEDSPADASPSDGGATTSVSANSATEGELVAALESAGVPSAAKWADEIMEYRPYADDDPTLPKLRKELAKYNPGPDVLAKILSALTP